MSISEKSCIALRKISVTTFMNDEHSSEDSFLAQD